MTHIMSETTAAMLRQKAAAKRDVFTNAATVAENLMLKLGTDSEIREHELISIVMNETGCRRPDAAYAVDSLRTDGVLVKNWQTGQMKVAAA